MAQEEHKKLATFLKEVHSSLRKSTSIIGAPEAWRRHCQNTQVLKAYAQSMQMLATKHWEENCSNESCLATSRIKWSADMAFDYFMNKSYIKFRQKEIDIGSKIGIILNNNEYFSEPIKLIDVGSCYNPFKVYNFLDVLAIDLYPANEFVLKCDFLNVSIGPEKLIEEGELKQIEQNCYGIVTFCFLLEYIPTSEQRVQACEKAYSILKPEGLLIINTPDSKHVGANCKLMKCWRYTLAHMGFTRIRYEKLKHMHCMAFRKSINSSVAVRWANLHKERYMEYRLHIPQDYQNKLEDISSKSPHIEITSEDFNELPFCNLDE